MARSSGRLLQVGAGLGTSRRDCSSRARSLESPRSPVDDQPLPSFRQQATAPPQDQRESPFNGFVG